MNKAELIDVVSKNDPHSKAQTEEMFNAFMAGVQNSLTRGNGPPVFIARQAGNQASKTPRLAKDAACTTT